MARIAEYYADMLDADRGYRAVLTHNPMAAAHGPRLVTTWGRLDPYRLDELGEVLPFGWRRPAVPATAIGRNCALFDALMRWAGQPVNEGFEVLPAGIAANQRFDMPLDAAEVAGIARSVERYRARWIAAGAYYTQEQKTLWGQARGRRSGAAQAHGRQGRGDPSGRPVRANHARCGARVRDYRTGRSLDRCTVCYMNYTGGVLKSGRLSRVAANTANRAKRAIPDSEKARRPE